MLTIRGEAGSARRHCCSLREPRQQTTVSFTGAPLGAARHLTF